MRMWSSATYWVYISTFKLISQNIQTRCLAGAQLIWKLIYPCKCFGHQMAKYAKLWRKINMGQMTHYVSVCTKCEGFILWGHKCRTWNCMSKCIETLTRCVVLPTEWICQVSNWYLKSCGKKVREIFRWRGVLLGSHFRVFVATRGPKNCPTMAIISRGHDTHYMCVGTKCEGSI